MFGIQTLGCEIVGVDKSTELRRPLEDLLLRQGTRTQNRHSSALSTSSKRHERGQKRRYAVLTNIQELIKNSDLIFLIYY